ncbi:MAG TPA: hypothetical protein VF341_04585 [Anaeromyxobacteraceae bacterium]
MARAAESSSRTLRAEHDTLAELLSVRRSIDHVRKGVYGGFTGLLVSGLATKLAFDRWFSTQPARHRGPPVYFFVAVTLAALLLAVAAWQLLRARRLMREEDRRFARLRALRRELELDP